MRRLQLILIATGLAAAVVMAGLFSTGLRIVCLAVAVAGAWATAPQRHGRGGGWWSLLAAGAALSVAGFALEAIFDDVEALSGLAAIAGAALVIIGATIGFPLGARRERR